MSMINEQDRIFTNLITCIGVPVMDTDGTKRFVFLRVGAGIGTRGQSEDASTVDVPRLDATEVEEITVSQKKTYSLSGFFTPSDTLNLMLSKAGWDGMRNVDTMLLTIFAHEKFKRAAGEYEAQVVPVTLTPQAPAADAGQVIALEVAMSQSGPAKLTYAKLDALTGRWMPTDEDRSGMEWMLYTDENGNITATKPDSTPVLPPNPPMEEPEEQTSPFNKRK